MGHRNKKSLIRQVQERLDSMLAIGQSKYEDKKLDLTKRKIYSWSTYKSYLQQCCQFVRYCKDKGKKEHMIFDYIYYITHRTVFQPIILFLWFIMKDISYITF